MNGQVENGLKVQQTIEEDASIGIIDKLYARNNLLIGFFNMEDFELYALYTEKYIKDFAENDCEYTKTIIEYYIYTKHFDSIDFFVNVYKNLSNVSIYDIEELYDRISVFASISEQYEVAIKYRIESLELCEIIDEANVYFDDTSSYLKIEKLGFLYGELGDCKKKIEYSLKGLELREKITGKLDSSYIDRLHDISAIMGLCFMDYTASLNFSEEALGLVTELYGINSEEYYTELFSIAGSYKMAYQYEKAIHCYTKCLDYYIEKQGASSEVYFKTMMLIADIYAEKVDYNKSIEMLLLLEEQLTSSSNLYRTLIHNIAITYGDLGNNKESLYWYQKEEQILMNQNISDSQILLTFYSSIANCLSKLNEFDKAESYYLKGLSIIQKLSKKEVNYYISQISTFYDNWAQLYIDKGDYKTVDKLQSQLERFISEKEINNPRVIALVLKLKAGLLSDIYNYAAAIEYYTQAFSLLIKHFPIEHPDITSIVNNVSVIQSSIGHIEESLRTNKTLLRIREETLGTSHPDYITTLHNIAVTYADLDSLELAKEYSDKALEAFPNNPAYLNNAALLYIKLQDFKAAEEYYFKSLKIIEETKGKGTKDYINVLSNLAFFYLQSGDYDNAKDVQVEIFEYAANLVTQFFSFLSENQRTSFWDNQTSIFESNYSLNWFYPNSIVNELSYNNILFSKGLLLRSSNEVRDAILTSENKDLIIDFESLQLLRQQITTLQAKSDSTMKSYIHKLEVRADSLDKALTLTSSEYRDLQEDLTLTWKNIQKELKPNEVAIEFFDFNLFNKQWTDSIMYCALIVRKNSEYPEYIPLFEASDLSFLSGIQKLSTDRLIQQTYTSGNSRFFNGDKLYKLLWQPLEKYLDGIETVYYSPSGLLNKVSFAAIPVDSVVLSDKYDLHLVSSTREIVQQKNRENHSQHIKNAIIYGGIIYSALEEELLTSARQFSSTSNLYASRFVLSDTLTRSGWDYLQGTEQEVKALENILHQSNVPTVKYTGVAANEESFKQLSSHSPEVIHIATHGFFLEDESEVIRTGFMQALSMSNDQVLYNPLLRSGLLMAGANRAWNNEDVISDIEDGILTAEEIAHMNLTNTQLVVLSACETGLGEVKNSEGVFGLQRAFKLAGVETLIMSLWKVPDQATSLLMTSFYSNWLNGMTKHQSFTKAQKALRQTYPEPYYWAGFVMMD